MKADELLKAIDSMLNYQPPFFKTLGRLDNLYYGVVSPAVYQACLLCDRPEFMFLSDKQNPPKAQLPFGIMRLRQRAEARKGLEA